MRNEYPRPDLVRDSFISLNGEWGFEFDDADVGHKEKWFRHGKFSRTIEVPFPFQSELSGLGDTSFHDYVWYSRHFTAPNIGADERLLLHFGSVDFYCEVYLNGQQLANHYGGNTAFSVDVTDSLEEDNLLVVYVYDPSSDEDYPRGKQYWKPCSESIWYNRTTGIWKSVWLERVKRLYLTSYRLIPDIDSGTLHVKLETSLPAKKIRLIVKDRETTVSTVTVEDNIKNFETVLDIWHNKVLDSYIHNFRKLWSPENPYLYDIFFELYDESGALTDRTQSYFGMRKVHCEDGIFYLNNRPYYQKLVLVQGYFKGGLLSAPDISCFEEDIKYGKAMGFNGCRVHQKVEDPYFYYLCDKLGFLAWCEYSNAANFSARLIRRSLNEWIEVVKQTYNHPSIVCYVPLNESWGVPHIKTSKTEQAYAMTLYHLTHALDETRPVVSNDGWEMVKTDICSIHNYCHGSKNEPRKYETFAKTISERSEILTHYSAGRPIYADGYGYEGSPIILSEFGGISYKANGLNDWGYTTCSSEEEYLHDLQRIFAAINNSRCLAGYCYTQLYDVEQETNGLLTYDRKSKVEPSKIKALNAMVENVPMKSTKEVLDENQKQE